MVVEDEGNLIARLPYVLTKHKFGIVRIGMPQLTQTLGPWIQEHESRRYSQLSREKKIMGELIDKLPPFDIFEQSFHYSLTNWMPFYWAGFDQTTRYTYVIEDISDLERVWQNFEGKKRRYIKKAQNIVEVRSDLPAAEFYDHHKSSLAKQGENISYEFALFERLYDAAYANSAGKTFYCVDSGGSIHSALFVVWGPKSAYFMISSVDPELRNSGSLSLLLWEAIKYVSTFTSRFDFEGSMIEGAEHSYRAFGGVQMPYSIITRCSKRIGLLRAGKTILRDSKSLFNK